MDTKIQFVENKLKTQKSLDYPEFKRGKRNYYFQKKLKWVVYFVAVLIPAITFYSTIQYQNTYLASSEYLESERQAAENMKSMEQMESLTGMGSFYSGAADWYAKKAIKNYDSIGMIKDKINFFLYVSIFLFFALPLLAKYVFKMEKKQFLRLVDKHSSDLLLTKSA